ncbi:MAG: aminoacyl-tRNA hydrolase [Thermoleophilia bacterium]
MARPAELLVVGLGNPGPEYERTRHNAGQLVVAELAQRHAFAPARRGFDGRFAAGTIAGRAVVVLVPTTYMNRSGKSVAAALRGLDLEPAHLLVVHDHIDLPFGRLRFADGGGHGGHNGLKSITGLVGAQYARLRVGVGRPASRDPEQVAAYVLEPFAEPRADVQDLIARAASAVEVWVAEGLEVAMNRINGAAV